MFYVDTKLVGGCVVMMRLMLCYCEVLYVFLPLPVSPDTRGGAVSVQFSP
jgi:hypothetical protein